MKEIKTSAELKHAIAELEAKTKLHEVTIKDQFADTKDSIKSQFEHTKEALKPRNVMRNTFSSLAKQPEVRKAFVSTLIGFGLGYFTKKATQVMTEESLNRLVSGFVEHGLDTVVKKNPDSLLAKGIHLTRHVAKEKGLKLF